MQRVSDKVTDMNELASRIRNFLFDPFDPANNSCLFDALVSRYIEHDVIGLTLEEAASVLEEHRARHVNYQFPDIDELRDVWPKLSAATKYLILTHDVEHALREIPQSVSGEYELAFSLLCAPRHKIDRLYGLIACSTAPYGALYSRSLAPYLGMLKSTKRFAMNIINRMCAE